MRTPFGIRASSARSWRRYYSSISCVSDRGLVRERKLIADGHHADSVPTAIPCAPSNWELSVARASAVAKLFVANGLEASRIGVMSIIALSTATRPQKGARVIDALSYSCSRILKRCPGCHSPNRSWAVRNCYGPTRRSGGLGENWPSRSVNTKIDMCPWQRT
jgi:hypothetical protein